MRRSDGDILIGVEGASEATDIFVDINEEALTVAAERGLLFTK